MLQAPRKVSSGPTHLPRGSPTLFFFFTLAENVIKELYQGRVKDYMQCMVCGYEVALLSSALVPSFLRAHVHPRM